MSVDWQTAAERLHRFMSMDADLRHDLVALGEEQARDDKLAFKLEEGRTYGMRQQFYETKLRRDLARSLRLQDVTEEHW